jgi:hypothetical protein
MTTSQPLAGYLRRRGFAPNPGNPTWLGCHSGQQTVRILYQPGETALLYCLTTHSACLYEAVFSPGTPDTVIIAAVKAALDNAQAAGSQPAPAAGHPSPARHSPAPGKEKGDRR